MTTPLTSRQTSPCANHFLCSSSHFLLRSLYAASSFSYYASYYFYFFPRIPLSAKNVAAFATPERTAFATPPTSGIAPTISAAPSASLEFRVLATPLLNLRHLVSCNVGADSPKVVDGRDESIELDGVIARSIRPLPASTSLPAKFLY